MRKLALLVSAALVVSAPLIMASPTFTYAAAKKRVHHHPRTAAPKETSPNEANSRFLRALADLQMQLATYSYAPGGDGGGGKRVVKRKRG